MNQSAYTLLDHINPNLINIISATNVQYPNDELGGISFDIPHESIKSIILLLTQSYDCFIQFIMHNKEIVTENNINLDDLKLIFVECTNFEGI